MLGKKYIVPAALAIGAVSMIGLQAFAQTAPTTTPQSQVQVQAPTTQAVDDQNKGADIETADDNASATVSGTDTETNDDGAQAIQNSTQDSNQADGETND